jgi:lipoic acid synthetase
MILGDICTRDCAFCAVTHGQPKPSPGDEPRQIAEAVYEMDLHYAVVTSVTRDDLHDGGASRFAEVIRAVRRKRTKTKIEVLIPDFRGDTGALDEVLEAGPDVLNHNLEVPEAWYPKIKRPHEHYSRSLGVLAYAKKQGAVTKSGLMVGLGESQTDLIQSFRDLRSVGCDLLTIGQYLQATKNNSSVVKYYAPDEFACLRDAALELGFRDVEAGPLVRSSYRAHRLFQNLMDDTEKTN